MAVALSAIEVTQLQAALKTLLSPFDFESIGAWRCEARRSVGALLRTDSSVSFLPLAGEEAFQADRLPALAQYAQHFHTMDPTTDYRSIGTEAFTWDLMRQRCERPNKRAWFGSEFYNDWVRPQRLCQPCGLTVIRAPEELPSPAFPKFSGIAGLWFYWDRDVARYIGERELTILQVLLPAFEAGIALLLAGRGERELVSEILGTLTEGVALYDKAGQVVHQSPTLRRFVSDEAPSGRLEAECAALASLVLLLATGQGRKSQPNPTGRLANREIRTAAGHYRIRGGLIAAGKATSGPAALVVVERATLTVLSERDLTDRYHLTDREATVSQLLAAGHSNGEVARLLRISIHTARHHAESVLVKLGVHTRAAVGAKLRGENTELSA